VLPMNEFLIYIRKHSMVFSHLGFYINIVVLCSSCDDVDVMLLMITCL
jgi:hypothetical protein